MVSQVVGAVAGSLVSKAIGGKASSGNSAGAAASANLEEANALNKEQITAAKDNLQFAKTAYADWTAVYGDIEKNLGDYYKNLSADKLTALGLQNQQLEFQKAKAAIQKDMAQRGIANSGIEVAQTTNAAFQNAEARARIRTEAPEKVAEAKQGFLSLGLAKQPALLANVGNAATTVNAAYASGVSANSGVAQSYIGQQTQLDSQKAENSNQIGGYVAQGVSGAFSNYFSK